MTVGEVWWVELSSRGGHEQRGHRPAIVLQTQAASKLVPTVLVIPLTTRLDALRFPGTVLIETTPENHLRRPSVALVFQITAIDQRYLMRHVGKVSSAILEQIFSALDELSDRGTT